MYKFIRLIGLVSRGDSACVIGNCLSSRSIKVGIGWLHLRSHAVSGLKSLRVDTVILLGDTPDEVERLAENMVRLSKYPGILHWRDQ